MIPTPAPTVQGESMSEDDYERQVNDTLKASTLKNDEQGYRVSSLINNFVQSYEQNKHTQPLNVWLSDEFRKYPVWKDEQEITETTQTVISTVEARNAAHASLETHLAQGKSEESWLATRIENGASAAGLNDVGRYAGEIQTALDTANQGMLDTITNRSGDISQAYNLDGFLAEQHHVDTFNIEAAAKGSSFRAKVLTPAPGETFGKNSMDVGIYDDSGKLVRRYQAKYGKDAQSTQVLFEKGDYRGQQKLVPAEQVDDLANTTDRIEHDGVSSKPLSKAEAKALQEKAQQQQESKQYEWNEVNRTQIAKNIGKSALISAGITAGFHGARIIGKRIWNALRGKENPPASEALNEFFTSSLNGAVNTGAQVAVSGAVVVAAKSGWLGGVLKSAKTSTIVQVAYTGMAQAKILYKISKGELSFTEGMSEIKKITASSMGSMMGAGYGAGIGAAIGTAFGPIGTAVGGFIGGTVGAIAGSAVGEAVHTASKFVADKVSSAVKSVASSVASGFASAGRAIASLFSW